MKFREWISGNVVISRYWAVMLVSSFVLGAVSGATTIAIRHFQGEPRVPITRIHIPEGCNSARDVRHNGDSDIRITCPR